MHFDNGALAWIGRVRNKLCARAAGLLRGAKTPDASEHPNGAPEGVTRQLARVEARLDRVTRDAAILKAALFLYVRVWLEHNPKLDEELEEACAESAYARLERYLDLVREGLEPRASVTREWEAEADAAIAETRR